jgi:hypothetical protein
MENPPLYEENPSLSKKIHAGTRQIDNGTKRILLLYHCNSSFFLSTCKKSSKWTICLSTCMQICFLGAYVRAQNFWPPLSALCFALHSEEVHLCATIMHIANGPLGGNRSKQCLSKASLPHGFWDPWAHYVSSQCLWLFHEGVLWPRANELFLLKNLLDKV